MSIFGVLKFLSNLGTSIANVGNLLSRIGFALSPPNLDGSQTDLNLDRSVSSQDPHTQGVKDEKPVEQERFENI